MLLYDELEAATDEPVAAMYKYLDFLYPNSLFILTERDEDTWLESASAHRRRHFARRKPSSNVDSPFNPSDSNWVRDEATAILRLSRQRDRTVERIFTQTALYGAVEFDEQKFREGYRRHHQEISSYFATRPGDLLRVRICEGEGWQRICDALGEPVPKEPFPNVRSSRDRLLRA
jgi:hypothetical protein